MTEKEKEALERRIDELCAEVERLHADQAHWELGNCPSCPNIADLQEALEQNAKLRELVDLYEFGSTHDQPPAESLAWNIEVAKLRRELGIEEDQWQTSTHRLHGACSRTAT